MGRKIVIKCDKGFDIDYEYHSKGGPPFHFQRVCNKGYPYQCVVNTMRLGEDEVCCHTGCCNCDHLNLGPLEE